VCEVVRLGLAARAGIETSKQAYVGLVVGCAVKARLSSSELLLSPTARPERTWMSIPEPL